MIKTFNELDNMEQDRLLDLVATYLDRVELFEDNSDIDSDCYDDIVELAVKYPEIDTQLQTLCNATTASSWTLSQDRLESILEFYSEYRQISFEYDYLQFAYPEYLQEFGHDGR